jgi:hypothetical protein
MSTEIGVLKESGSRNVDLSVTRYSGGNKGICVQLTALQEDTKYGYVQLSVDDLHELIPILTKFITNYSGVHKSNRFVYDEDVRGELNDGKD